jgi:hypothetical protein
VVWKDGYTCRLGMAPFQRQVVHSEEARASFPPGRPDSLVSLPLSSSSYDHSPFHPVHSHWTLPQLYTLYLICFRLPASFTHPFLSLGTGLD